jgi:hypothetical protein
VIDTLLGGLLGVVTGRGIQQASQSANTNSGDIVVSPSNQDGSTDSTVSVDEQPNKIQE